MLIQFEFQNHHKAPYGTYIHTYGILDARIVHIKLADEISSALKTYAIIIGSLRVRRFGRKLPLMCSIVLQLVSGIGCAIVPWFPALLFMKFFSAVATGGTMVTSYVICEYCS